MLTDYHTHIGQYYNIYTTPEELVRVMDTSGIDRFATSSTTICDCDYNKVLSEMSTLVRIAGARFLPILWIVPSMLQDGGLQLFLDSSIEWKILKIHPQLYPATCVCGNSFLRRVISLAKRMRLPLLIHTGDKPGCFPSLYERVISRHSDVTFILAHGRPIEEAITVMRNCPNTMVDTAFMPVEDQRKLVDKGFASRLLFGTDIPINKYYYPQMPTSEFVQKHLDELRSVTTEEQYLQIINNTPFKK